MVKVLLVEDNEMNIDMLARRLKKRGYEVVVAVNGTEAVEKAHGERPDVILMDVELPDIDGWEASRRLKGDDATKDIPIIAVTAHAMAEHEEKSRAAGCDAFETKPVNFTSLTEKIRALTGTT
jgi:two-component system response regulator